MKLHLRPFALVSALSIPLLTGCGAGTFATSSPSEPVSVTGALLHGVVMGGQQPVANVQVQIYAASTGGYGQPSTPLLEPGAVTTTSNGNFTLTPYNCPSQGSLLYLTGTGGQPIAATASRPAVTNNNLSMMVALGPCGTINPNTFIAVNEVTTVASVWALAPFMSGLTSVATSSSNQLGLTNAFAAVNKIVNTANATLPGPALPANAVLPTKEIYTLADILEQCVNSGGGSASDTTDGQTNGSGCGKLFYLTTVNSQAPTDTVTAALNIAKNPGNNVAKLNMLRSASPVFQPVLSANAPPNAWTIAINYVPGNLNVPGDVAADLAGNIWVADSNGQRVVLLNSTGANISGSAGYAQGKVLPAAGVVTDQSGNAWVAGATGNNVLQITPAGVVTSIAGAGINNPQSLAIDGQNEIWLANQNSLSGVTASGTAITSTAVTSGGVHTPVSVAIH